MVRTGMLDGRVALVTGGSRNIGAATCRLLAQHGARVAINYHESQAHAEELLAAIAASGCEGMVVPANVTDADSVDRMMESIVSRWGRLDILVNNARPIGMSRESFLGLASGQLEERVTAELRSVEYCCRSAFPHLKSSPAGRVINVSSIAGRRPGVPNTSYRVAKGALETLSRSIASEFAPFGITVNVVAPGSVITDRERPAEELNRIVAETPMGRVATVDEVAGAIVLFAFDEARFVTGQYLYVTGGTIMP